MSELYEFQKQGVEWLLSKRTGILGDDMGLGKTVQAIATLNKIPNQPKRCIIVCPNSVKGSWEKEIKKWYIRTESVIYQLQGNQDRKKRERIIDEFLEVDKSKTAWLLVNYQLTLRHDFTKYWYDCMIVDEAHRIKSRNAKQTKEVKRISRKVRGRSYLLTGTPVQNHPEELWSLLHFMDKETFSSYWRFVKTFCYIHYTPFSKYGEVGELRPEMLDHLREILDIVLLRRIKENVLTELPEKTYEFLEVEMNEVQRKLYREMAKDMLADNERGTFSFASTVVAQQMKLKQFAISPQLLGFDNPGRKLDEAFNLIQDYTRDGKQIVVFSFFNKAIQLLKKKLDKTDITYGEYTGTNTKTRDADKDLFQAGKLDTMLCTTQAGGEGINLYSADTVLFLDRMWTPSQNEQCEDRLHRIGQKNAVTVIVLVTKGTIDEDIENTLTGKDTLIRQVIQDKKDPTHWKKYLEQI
jgi:SNF2 family DNA or RNA helicase